MAANNPLVLLTLARDNRWEDIQAAVASGIPVDISNQMGQTALHIASLWGNVETIQVLLQLGMDAGVMNARGSTPLHFAASARKNARQVCELLLAHGAPTDKIDMSGRVPYECADSDEVRTLLGGPDARLFEFCEGGDAAALEDLLNGDTVDSLRVVDSEGRTPLNMAIASGSLATVKVLLRHDPSLIHMPDMTGDSALHVAVPVGVVELLSFLLALKPDVNMRNISSTEYATGNWLLAGEPLPPHDKTALHLAVAEGDLEAATLLLDAGAKPDILDFDAASCLHLALENQDMPLIQLLLERGADVNLPNKDFVSALHLAASRGPASLLQLLLDSGAAVAATGSDLWTPLHLASRAGNVVKMEKLLAAGAPVDAVNAQGNTPLHLASVNGHLPAVQLLLQHAANCTVINKDGRTAADLAKGDAVKQALLGAAGGGSAGRHCSIMYE